ncbi:NBAS subunit of NRZ tethering complex isoform X1 [Lampetra fluviatilis]
MAKVRLGSRRRDRAASMEAGEDVILYDLLVHAEWPPESELAPRGSRDLDIAHKSFAKKAASALTAPLWLVVQYARCSSSPCCSLPPGLVQLLSRQVNWQVVLSSNGNLLAVVQDACIEIRSAKDDFSATIGKCTISRDAFPQWRRVAWSHDCTLLAIAESSGTVHVFDLMGTHLFTISQAAGSSGDLGLAVAGLVFLEYTASAQWSAELLVINYAGHLTSYLVSLNTNQGYQENHKFSFTPHYPHGITAVVYQHTHRLLLVGGCESGDFEAGSAAANGLTAWRVLSSSPHYKQVTSISDDLGMGLQRSRLLTRLPGLPRWGRVGRDQDGIYKLSLSPDASVLAAVHFSGKLSIWEVPSLSLKQAWSQEQQPGYDEVNPQWVTSVDRKRKMKDKWWLCSLADVNWWADGALILARCSGSLTVSSARTLSNLLGPSAEWFEPAPLVTAAHNGGLLALECEVKQVSLKRPRADEVGPARDEGGDESNDEEEADGEASLLGRSGRVVRRGLYLLTESERFAPPRKRPRNLVKTYRLVSLRSTTPEELYQRKIDSEEYGEALLLAQAYGLDTDLVYQRQWRKSPVNIASIQDYLSKIKKRSWVLHECLERLADSVDAAKELLQYGLKGTGLEALLAIGRGDDGRFIEAGDVDIEEFPYEDMSPEEELERRTEKEEQRRKELQELVNFTRLTVEQKDLCRSRLRLLTYLDRLATYEEILGGPHAAEQRYNTEFFKSFRSQNLVLSARNYARESDWQALEILFRYHSEDLLTHRLPILSNFLETTSPHEYRYLLPEAQQNDKGELVVVPLHESRHRDTDWCEDPQCRSGADVGRVDLGDFLYEEQPELRRFRTRDPSVALLSQWYQQRAHDIESLSRQVDSALSLVRLGQEKLVPGLEPLLDDLMLLDTLVYEANIDPTLTLHDLQAMHSLARLRLLMSKSPAERYVQDALRWLVPFLQRLETACGGSAAAPLLREYLVGLAQSDLAPPLQIFQHSKPQLSQRIIPDNDELMRVALECTYSCTRDDQLSLCYDILECLPQRGSGQETDVTRDLHDQVDVMEQHLSVAEILEKHGVPKPISFVRDSQGSREEAVKLLTRLTRQAGRRVPPLSEEKWKSLLEDILEMQKTVYKCLDEETCYEVFTESLLCSGRTETLQLAARMVQCSAVQPVRPLTAAGPGRLQPGQRLAYARSLELVLGAAREYFNASKSLADDSMDVARECLKLITDAPPRVQEELDLMSALALLEEFKLEMLPLEVRLCQDRLSLIKKVMEQSSWAYKYPSKMLHLASLLRVAGSDRTERSGQVLTLLAEQALQAHDYRSTARLCHQIISEAYGGGWSVCSSLAQCHGALELPERQELLAFALTHCPADTIQSLLAASCSLRAQMLYESVDGHGETMRNNSSEQHVQLEELDRGGLLQKTSALTAGVIASTTHGTRVALHAIAQPHLWAKSLSYLRPLQTAAENDEAPEARGRAAPERQAWHPFYASLGADGAGHKGGELYPDWAVAPVRQAELHLQAGKLLETSGGGLHPFPASQVLLELASETMSTDTTLALAYLLALSDPLEADVCFERQSATALSLQLAVYYYALQIHVRLQPSSGRPDSVYWADPGEVVARASEWMAEAGGSAPAVAARPEELAVLEGRLRLYGERLADLTQAQTLRSLGAGVDVQRFAVDAQYKRGTILGLVETLDDATYELSMSLARRYEMPLWELYMTHLEFLFTDSGLATRQVEQRVAALGLVSELKADPAGVLDHMTKYVYPGVPGGDHARLLCYFGLLESCGCGDDGAHPGKPGAHLQLLKKLRSTTPDLDYKKLMDTSANPLDALRPVLTSQNVTTVAKLVPKLPTAGGLTQSAVFATWLRRLFWNGTGKDGDEVDWGRRYRDCEQLLGRLSPPDLDAFLQEVTVSADAVDQLPIKARVDTAERAAAFVEKLKGRPASRKKGGGGGGSVGDGEEAAAADAACEDGARTLDDVVSRLHAVRKHLQSLRDDAIAALRHSEQEQERAYARAFDLACSEEKAVLQLALRLALDGRPLPCVHGVLRAALGERRDRVRDAIHRAVLTIVDALQERPEAVEPLGGKAPLEALEGIVSAVRSHSEDGGKLVSADNLLSWLRPFCTDAALPVRPRVAVLQILEQAFRLGDEEGHLLAFYRTQAVLTDAWPHRTLDMAEVRDEEGRLRLFEELLGAGVTPPLVTHLMLLLQAWPPMSDTALASRDACPWLHLAAAVLSASSSPAGTVEAGATVLGISRSLRGTRHALPTPCVEQLLDLLLERSLLLPALKLALDGGDVQLHERAIGLITTAVTEVDHSNCDPELLGLLLTQGLAVACLPTTLYPHLIGHLLSNWETESWDVEEVAAELKAAGHGMEAASLVMAHRRTPPALGTFNAAASFLKQWLQG